MCLLWAGLIGFARMCAGSAAATRLLRSHVAGTAPSERR